jgi:hypothetical protein
MIPVHGFLPIIDWTWPDQWLGHSNWRKVDWLENWMKLEKSLTLMLILYEV